MASAACSRSTSASTLPAYSANASASLCHACPSVLPACSNRRAVLPPDPRKEPLSSSNREIMSHDKGKSVPPEKHSKKPIKKAATAPKQSEPPTLSFATAAQFSAWLKKQPAASPGVWLRLGK